MPYIKQEDRTKLDPFIEGLARNIETEGELNYAISRLAKHAALDGPQPVSYSRFNAVVGVLECARLEFYRRWVVPYEDIKREENGDV